MEQHPKFSDVLNIPAFRYLWINQILVQIAYNTLNFALLIWVYKLTHSNLAVSALMLCIYLPALFFGLFAGVLVDLLDRRKIILLIDILLAVSFLAFIFVRGSLPLILINTFIINSLSQFFMPSESSSIPLLVDRKHLMLANSLFSLTLYGSLMTGFSIGGPILNTFGINAIFIGGALSLGLAFLLSRQLPAISVNSESTAKLQSNTLSVVCELTIRETKKTFSFIRSKLNVAVAIVLMSAVQGIIGMLAVMLPSYMEKALLIHATDSSYFVMFPLGLGMVIGALISGRLFHKFPRRSIVIPAIIAAGILFILIGIAPHLARWFQTLDLPSQLTRPRYFFRAPSLSTSLGLLAFLLGLATVSIIIPCQTVLQENTPEKDRGKIFAVLAVIMTAASALPVILTGALSDIVGVTPIFAALGATVLMIGLTAKKPSLVFQKKKLPSKVTDFLGNGHWEKVSINKN